jgi:hypothetical protein
MSFSLCRKDTVFVVNYTEKLRASPSPLADNRLDRPVSRQDCVFAMQSLIYLSVFYYPIVHCIAISGSWTSHGKFKNWLIILKKCICQKVFISLVPKHYNGKRF